MKALVTGTAGFIGSTLAEQLVAQGAEVVGIDCFTDYYPRAMKERNLAGLLNGPRFTFIESTIQNADLASILNGCSHVFHLAAQAGVRKSWGRDFAVYTVNNIEATQVLLEAVTRASTIERLVYASSSSVYGDLVAMPMREDALPQPVSPYGVTKLAAEQLCYLYYTNFTWASISSFAPQFVRNPSACTATASRRATLRLCTTPSARRLLQPRKASRGVCTILVVVPASR